jgi:hypothetical protein
LTAQTVFKSGLRHPFPFRQVPKFPILLGFLATRIPSCAALKQPVARSLFAIRLQKSDEIYARQ